jgi:hypothetical protein
VVTVTTNSSVQEENLRFLQEENQEERSVREEQQKKTGKTL